MMIYIATIAQNEWFYVMAVFQLIAKGKDASDLFPAVVKNVVSKNIEVC